MNIKNNFSLFDYLYWGILFIVILAPIITIGDHIGLYFDAINPDYVATQILNPQAHQERWHWAYPYLNQPWHGNIVLLITLVSTLITGGTSCIQHHFNYVLLTFIILILFNLIFKKYNIGKELRRICIFVFALLPSISINIISQNYIQLPGVILILTALYLYLNKDITKYSEKKNLTIDYFIFFLLGLAFYSYFNFLFFFPCAFIFYILREKNFLCKIRNSLISGYGFLAGSCLYFAGYSLIIFWKADLNQLLPSVPLILCCGLLLFCIFLFYLTLHHKYKIVIFSTLLFLVVCFSGLFFFKENIKNFSQEVQVAGYFNASIYDRILLVLKYIKSIITGYNIELLIYNKTVTHGLNWCIGFWFLVNILYFTIFILNYVFKLFKPHFYTNTVNKNNLYIILRYWFFLGVYFICCVCMVTRMLTHHFLPIIFLMFIILVLQISQIFKFFYFQQIFLQKTNQGIFVCIAIWFSILFLINRTHVVTNIVKTNGYAFYSALTNHVAYDALKNLDNGEKEFYILPQWGIMAGFGYLTNNNIPFQTWYNLDIINQYLNEGYTVCFTFWNFIDANKKDELLKLLKDSISTNISVKEFKNHSNNTVIYKIMGSK